MIRRLAALLLVFPLACDGRDAPGPKATAATNAAAPARKVKAVVVESKPWESTLELLGELRAAEHSVLGAKVAGRLAEVAVDVGDRVEPGQSLARQDDVDYRLDLALAEARAEQTRALLGLPPAASEQGEDGDAKAIDLETTPAVKQARARLEQTTADLARRDELQRQDMTSKSEYDLALAARKVAESEVEAALQDARSRVGLLRERETDIAIARQRLVDTRLTAPFKGEVLARLAGRGDSLAPGTPVIELLRTDPLRLVAFVPAQLAPRAAIGQTLRFRIDGDPQDAEQVATVARATPDLENKSRSLRIEADLPGGPGRPAALRVGAFARIVLVVDPTATALAAPFSSVRSFAGVDRILKVENGAVVEAVVHLGRRRGDEVEVESGLKAGDRILVDPADLEGGDPVEPVEPDRP